MRVVLISPATARTFAEMYSTEPSSIARTELVKGLALLSPAQTTGFDRECVTTITKALSDTSADVVQVAALGVGNLKLSALLPRVVALLKAESKGVRLAAAQAIASFGPDAVQYAPAVDAAIDHETDPIVRETLQGVARGLRGGQ